MSKDSELQTLRAENRRLRIALTDSLAGVRDEHSILLSHLEQMAKALEASHERQTDLAERYIRVLRENCDLSKGFPTFKVDELRQSAARWRDRREELLSAFDKEDET